jgi:hypothetical protein
LRAQVSTDLNRRSANGPGRPCDQQAFTFRKPCAVDQKFGCRQATKEEGGPFVKAQVFGQWQKTAVGRDRQILGMGATLEAHETKHPLALCVTGDPRAGCGNLSGKRPAGGDAGTAKADRQADHQPKPARNLARPHPGVTCGNRSGADPDKDLARRRGRNRRLGDCDALRRAIGGIGGDFHRSVLLTVTLSNSVGLRQPAVK